MSDIPNMNDVYGSPKVPPRRDHVEPREVIREIEVTAPVDTDASGVTWVGNVGLSSVGLVIPNSGISENEWTALFSVIANIRTSWQFIIGDWFAYGNTHFNFSYGEIAQATGYKESTVMAFASVCRNVPLLTRVKTLDFAHHRRVSRLPLDKQIEALNHAAENNLSVREFQAYLSGHKRKRLSSGRVRKSHYEIIDKNELRRLKNADQKEREKMAEKLRKIADDLVRGNSE